MRLFSRHQARLEDRRSGGSRSWGGGYEPPLLDVDIHGHAVSAYRQTAPPGPPVHTARLPLSFPFQCTARQYTPLFMQCPARAQLGPNGPLRPRELQSVSAPGVSPGFRNLAVASAAPSGATLTCSSDSTRLNPCVAPAQTEPNNSMRLTRPARILDGPQYDWSIRHD